ncbi:unnamed protein product, partial [Trichobilharzia regenti]
IKIAFRNTVINSSTFHLFFLYATGKLRELHPVVTAQRNESTESVFHGDSNYNGYQSENKFSLWEIKSDYQTTGFNSMEPGFLLSVQMDGYLYCSEAICGM